jgi:hypothetical protein
MKEKQTLAGMTKSNKKTEGNPMKKYTVLLLAIAISIAALLSACKNDNPDTNANPSTNPNSNEQSSHQEQLAGVIQAIDGMKLTIDTSGIFVANETGSHIVSGEGELVENQEVNIHLTEQTNIVISISDGGLITETKAGIVDDLTLQSVVIADGEWEGDEFIATELLVYVIENPLTFN